MVSDENQQRVASVLFADMLSPNEASALPLAHTMTADGRIVCDDCEAECDNDGSCFCCDPPDLALDNLAALADPAEGESILYDF